MKLGLLAIFTFLAMSTGYNSGKSHNTSTEIIEIEAHHYSTSYEEFGLKKTAFDLATAGLKKLENKLDQKHIITIIDFDLSSTKKRLWVLDLKSQKVLFNTYVAHGRNSGNDLATKFSNISGSNQSSLGFYITSNTYQGKHGLSLLLDGQEKGINDKARSRAIVIHGADYVSANFIKKHGRLGRSFGCPSLPKENYREIITTIANGSGLFIHRTDKAYLAQSKLTEVNAKESVALR